VPRSGLHPIVGQLAPSDEQMPAVVARGCDVAVTAGAGAGKTRTLVARYLSLLADGLPLRSVVAITFTRKAAREMRNRVREEVRRFLSRAKVPEEERAFWRDVQQGLDAARIGTIHGLCAEILRRHPVEASTGGFVLDPRFEMLDEGQQALLLAEAADAALSWAADDQDTARVFADLGERDLRDTVARLLQRRLDVADAVPAGDDLWAVWRDRLTAPLRAYVDDAAVGAGFADLCRWRDDGSLDRAAAAGDALVSDYREVLRHWDAIASARSSGDWGEVSRHLAPLRNALKQKGSKRNWAPADPKPVIKALQTRYDELVKPVVSSGIDLDLDRRAAREVVPALLRVFGRALQSYDAAKQARRALDFDDLESMAIALLKEHGDVRAYWQSEVKALLVDEYQDTNARQRDLVNALNGDAGKLFIVGDGKQSIYRFRGADVGVFRGERESIAGTGQGLELATSYRSHAALVAGLNALLQPVLGAEPDPDRPYVEPFSPLVSHRATASKGFRSPFVELHLAVGTREAGADLRAARMVAARLVDLVGSGSTLVPARDGETGSTAVRSLDYGDIAVLCRASRSFAAYEDAFEAVGIPYLTVAGRGFYDRSEVRDLLNALRALADAADDLVLAGLLRSPAFGLTDMALVRLRRLQTQAGTASLWDVLRAGDLGCLREEASRAGDAGDTIDHLRHLAGRASAAEVLKALLDVTGYRAGLLMAGQRRAVSNVTKLLADAHASGIVGLDAFVAYTEELRTAAPREGEARVVAEGAVQIMSVHQAKGLEFPVVVIGDASRSSAAHQGVLIDSLLGVVPRLTAEVTVPGDPGELRSVTSAAYRLAQASEAAQSVAESARLLYVAATRVQELLLVSGSVKATSRGALSTTGWLRDLAGGMGLKEHAPHLDPAGTAVHRFECELQGQPVACTIVESEAPLPVVTVSIVGEPKETLTLPNSAMLAPLVLPPSEADVGADEEYRDPPRRVWRVVPPPGRDRAPAWVVGQIVHVALAGWLFPDDAADADLGHEAAARREALASGLTDDGQVRNAIGRAAGLLRRFRRHPLCTEMSSAVRRLHEVPYSVLDDDGVPQSGVIDALYRTSAGWTLVEFKTDEIRDDAALARSLGRSDYVRQVRRYRLASERLLGAPVAPIICLLNYRRTVRLLRPPWPS